MHRDHRLACAASHDQMRAALTNLDAASASEDLPEFARLHV